MAVISKRSGMRDSDLLAWYRKHDTWDDRGDGAGLFKLPVVVIHTLVQAVLQRSQAAASENDGGDGLMEAVEVCGPPHHASSPDTHAGAIVSRRRQDDVLVDQLSSYSQ